MNQRKKNVLPAAALLLAMALLLSACGTASSGSGGQPAPAAETEHSGAGTVVLPRKADYAAGPAWDSAAEPTRDNGPWAQSYAVFEALETAAKGYENVAPSRSFSLACHDPVDSGPGQLAAGWANAVTVATEGRVRVNVGYSGSLSGAMSSLDDMKQGLIDFVWTLPCYFKGYMPLTNVIQNPALGIRNGTAASYAMWELYKSSPELQAETADDGVLLFACANCTSPLSYKGTGEIEHAAEISGNIRANNGPAQLFVNAVGANVFSCPIGEVYNNVQHGIIDYLVTDWNGIDSFSLSDPSVLNYYVDTNVGCSAFALLANADIWGTIDGELREAILSASGDYMLNLTGIWDYWEALGRYHAATNGGYIYAPSGALEAELGELYNATAEAWIAAQDDADAARRLYEDARNLVSRYNDEYAW